jgi:hypothetical protein
MTGTRQYGTLSIENMARSVGVPDCDVLGLDSTAEATTLQLEFRYLSFLTGKNRIGRELGRSPLLCPTRLAT